jgi:polyisoprenoid-binding protein YceI
MKKPSILSTVIIAVTLFSFVPAENTTWTLDNAHAKLGFTITHLMVSDVEGYFKKVTAVVTTSKDDFTDAVAEMTAEVSSVNTDNDRRDAHLQSPDFFDAAKFPTITFKSTSFKKSEVPGTYLVKGNLTMHGITKPVTLTAVSRIGANPMNKKVVAGFKITGTVKRTDFGIGGSMPAAVISDEVTIFANAEFGKN